jgi:hypothetical protein
MKKKQEVPAQEGFFFTEKYIEEQKITPKATKISPILRQSRVQ